MTTSLFTTTDEIINIYKTASEHKKFIADLEATFMDEYNLLVSNISEAKPEANNEIYFKITNKKENHRGFQYKDGMNSNTQPFIPSGCCSGGGLYFTSLENLHMFSQFGVNIRPIIVPSAVPIYDEVCTMTSDGHDRCHKYHYKSKASSVYMLPKIKIGSDESIKLLYNPITNLMYNPKTPTDQNNLFIISRMYLANNVSYLNRYDEYYTDRYVDIKGNLNVSRKDILTKSIIPNYAKHRVFHPEHKQIIHCKVKELISSNKCDELFDLIYNKKTFLHWFYYKPTNKLYYDRTLYICELFYIFLKTQDKIFLRFMKDEYLPRVMALPHIVKAQETLQDKHINMPLAIENIKADIKSSIHENIYKVILKYGGIISGSFALKHLIGGDWKCHDVDVYLPAINITHRSDIFHIIAKDLCPEIRKIGIYNDCGDVQSYNMSNIDGIVDIYQINGINIQFIFTKIDPYEFIKENFDFDFCKVVYRPETEVFDIAHPNLNNIQSGRIETAYMDKISTFNMDDSFSVYRASKTLDRLNKYIERGFTISNLDEFFVCIEKLFED